MPYVISIIPVSISAGWNEMLSTSLCVIYLILDPATVVLVMWDVHYFVVGEAWLVGAGLFDVVLITLVLVISGLVYPYL